MKYIIIILGLINFLIAEHPTEHPSEHPTKTKQPKITLSIQKFPQ